MESLSIVANKMLFAAILAAIYYLFIRNEEVTIKSAKRKRFYAFLFVFAFTLLPGSSVVLDAVFLISAFAGFNYLRKRFQNRKEAPVYYTPPVYEWPSSSSDDGIIIDATPGTRGQIKRLTGSVKKIGSKLPVRKSSR